MLQVQGQPGLQCDKLGYFVSKRKKEASWCRLLFPAFELKASLELQSEFRTPPPKKKNKEIEGRKERKEKLEVTGKRTRRMSPSNSTCPTSSTWHFDLPNVLPPLVFCLIEEKCRFKVFLGHSVRPFKWKSRKAGDVAQW